MKKLRFFLIFSLITLFCGITAEATDYLFTIDESFPMLMSEDGGRMSAVSAEHGVYKSSDEEYVKTLLAEGLIDSYEEDGVAYLMDYTPSDKYYSEQEDYLDMIYVPFAWEHDDFGESVKIAVIDSGFSTTAGDPPKNITRAHDYITGNGDCDDTLGHGTFVTSIIAAEHNARGIAGIAPDAELYIFKCFDENKASYSDIAAAIYEATDKYDCNIINMSLGGSGASSILYNAVTYAYKRGVLIVAAAGNYGSNGVDYYPAAYDTVIAVGSVGKTGHRTTFSQQRDYVDIMAPGSDVYSADLSDEGYGAKSGTSFSTPHVTAALALAKSLNPELSMDSLTEVLYLSADAMIDSYSGHGLLNVQKLLTLTESTLSEGTVVYSTYDKYTVLTVSAPKGARCYIACCDADGCLESIDSRVLTVKTADIDLVRVFVWERDTLAPTDEEIGKTEY